MSISASDVKSLREKTGLGMMECKKALEEANGDAELAITNLRKNSALKAEKKSSRTAVEGIILANTTNTDNSILIEINCETDFVATKSVSQLISISIELSVLVVLAKIIPSTAVLEDFFSAFKALFFLKFVIANSASPLASSSAFLHSIIPKPVFSLKLFTSLALILI